MNPFESIKGGYVDPSVLSYFSLVQKKDVNTRCKALLRIVSDLEKLPVDSVAQCLYDTMPILCRSAQEPIATYISEIFLHVLKKSIEDRRVSSICHWVGMFLARPNKTGYKVVKTLSKNGLLRETLAAYNRTADLELYIKSKMVELAFEENVDVCVEKIKKVKTKSEMDMLSKLLSVLEEKKQLSAEIREAALSTAKSQTVDIESKWKLFAVLTTGYTVEELIEDSAKIDDATFSSIVCSKHFEKIVAEYGAASFIQNCAHLPGILFPALLRIVKERKTVLKKLLQSNTTGFEHIELEIEDFPYANTIGCYNRVNEVLQKAPIHDTKVYAELTSKEKIIRADILGEKIENISPEVTSQISISFLRREKIFEEGVRVLPVSFFRNEDESFTQEEHIYVAAQHPQLASEKTIDLIFVHKLFIVKILSSLSDDLMAYLMKRIGSEPADVVHEVYELIREHIDTKYEFKLLGKIYTGRNYRKEHFKRKLVLTEDVEESYLVYLIEREAVDEESVFKHIVQDANKSATGTQDVTDAYIELCEIIENKEATQAASKYVFGNAYSKWKKVLESLADKNLSTLLKDILCIESALPSLADASLPEWILTQGLVGKIAEGMLFWKDIYSKRMPCVLSALMEKKAIDEGPAENNAGVLLKEMIIKMYVDVLANTPIEESALKNLSKLSVEKLPKEDRAVLAYMLLKIQKSTKQSLLSISLKDAHALHSRVLSLVIQDSADLQDIEDLDFTHLSKESISHIQTHLESSPEKAAVCIKSDSVWEMGSNMHRQEMYTPVLKAIAKHYASSILNVYSMSKVEEDAIDSEVFYMLFDIPAIKDIKNMTTYEWRLFLTICSEVRSIEIRSLISAMVRAECKWLAFLISSETKALDLLGLFAKNFPVLARIFFKSSRNARQLQKYFIAQVTPQLIREEASRPLQGVKIKVKTIAETHIVVAMYKIEESELEVNINFPKDYPLSTPEVKVVRCVGVKKQRLQRLLLRIQMIMAEHCRIGEALALWKMALDKAVDEIEECGICFFMVDEATKNFPDASCSKCSNQFHGMCLKKWLERSKNLCPICREEIKS
ncbi:hypothetical protein NEMIN01_1674 [Nematocida minor]|uniref:uncharacterized protein n=1 Tax=Nematocida minor TaxID=1912983 RepID=UPI00221E614D|nr:uncharacterized protein NEMIN01_1674 [Nematocida minor]KAI5191783.1 hypothetical protein NEMIN01_1674 [Nematocida minor]